MNERLALTALALVLVSPTLAAQPDDSRIEFEQCDLRLPGTTVTAEARCGFLDVPENPDQPDGRRISLHVAVAPARNSTSEPDPLFFFAGGPGQAASESWPLLRGVLRDVNRSRDIVMIDQRGTGQSNPLTCPIPEGAELDTVLDLDFVRDWTADCRDQLDADLTQYTTTRSAHDFDRVREAIGYETINLLGVSYGTRMAQVYLREFPERVRSVVLDSVVPMTLALGSEHAVALDQALDQVLGDCADNDVCAARFPNLGSRLDRLVAELRETPRDIVVVHPVTGTVEPMRMDADTLAVAIRILAYQSATQGMLPLLIHEATEPASDGHEPLARLAAQAIMVEASLGDQIYRGLEMSVMCTEDFPDIVRDPAAADTLMGDTMYEALDVQCGVWPRGDRPDDFHQPVRSDTPVLLLSGERDPVTPPRYADAVAEHLPNSVHLVAGGQGHAVSSNACMRDVIAEFVAAAAVDDLDTDCVERIQPAPFFTTLLGPEP